MVIVTSLGLHELWHLAIFSVEPDSNNVCVYMYTGVVCVCVCVCTNV